jgi:zinc transport system ATP-binding protein
VDELYPLVARDVVRMGMERGWSFLRSSFREPPGVLGALDAMGVRDLADRPFRLLSEGQKQRVLFARLAASGADVALLDEPTSAMDLVAERAARALVDELRSRATMAVIVVSHFLGIARDYGDRAVLLDRDQHAVVCGTPNEVFSSRVFRTSYGEADLDELCAHGHVRHGEHG